LIKVFVNGYGNIGRRLAAALKSDPEIQLIGIGKYTVDERTKEAAEKGYALYVPDEVSPNFVAAGYQPAGNIKQAVIDSDLVVDAAKEGGGFENKTKYYVPLKKPAIFQGGEDRHGDHAVAGLIHNSRVNFVKASTEQYVIQGSCNVSGMGRVMQPLIERFGEDIIRWDVSLIRRWADLEDAKPVKDSIEWDRHPHHQDDVKDFIPRANLYVDAFKVPSRMMHLHHMQIRFNGKAPSEDRILDCYSKEFGVAVLHSAKGTADVRKKAIELGFGFGDTNMVHIHADVLRTQGDIVKIGYSDDQTGMVIPENHLLIQSMAFKRPRNDALKRTDALFRIAKKREVLEEEFK
jgi:glyceraldehyde-3-phosphate dehydrogenase (NAD(P))